MTDYKTYYNQLFQLDLLSFIKIIPANGNSHYNAKEFNIQYFYLTPQYKYLNVIPPERHGLFTVALYWTVLFDQVFFTYYPQSYQTFRRKTLYPKFIGNCTAPSLMSSMCGQHLHPRKILQAVNDTFDKGNKLEFDREIFRKDKNVKRRSHIDYDDFLQQALQVMKLEIRNYFENHQPDIGWMEFWIKCENEQ